MVKTKCALLDTDFISKLHITRKDDENRLIDRVLELQDYYYFNESNYDMIKELLPALNAQGKLRFLPVKTFWEDCYEK